MNANDFITKDYRKKDDFKVRINKPNFQNAKNERKVSYNKGLQKKRCFCSSKNKPNSNPISSKDKMNLELIRKSGHTRFCSWSDLRLQLWESSSSINNQTLIYELNHGYVKTILRKGK